MCVVCLSIHWGGCKPRLPRTSATSAMSLRLWRGRAPHRQTPWWRLPPRQARGGGAFQASWAASGVMLKAACNQITTPMPATHWINHGRAPRSHGASRCSIKTSCTRRYAQMAPSVDTDSQLPASLVAAFQIVCRHHWSTVCTQRTTTTYIYMHNQQSVCATRKEGRVLTTFHPLQVRQPWRRL